MTKIQNLKRLGSQLVILLIFGLFCIVQTLIAANQGMYPSSTSIGSPESKSNVSSGAFLQGEGELLTGPTLYSSILIESPESEAFTVPFSASLTMSDVSQNQLLFSSSIKVESSESETFQYQGGEVLIGASGDSFYSQVSIQSPESESSVHLSDVFVVNDSPTATDLEIEYQAYCGIAAGVGLIGFKWTYSDSSGDPEARFDFQVDNNPDFLSPEIDRSFDGLVNPSPTENAQVVEVVSSLQSDKIQYNTTYYWRVMVFDNRGGDSGWVEASFFETVSHAYPYPDFIWFPFLPSQEEVAQFCAVQEGPEACLSTDDKSTCYSGSGAIPPPSCSGETFLWTFPTGTTFATGTSATSSNPGAKLPAAGLQTVSLRITDDAGASCITPDKVIGISLPLPKEWREAGP